MKNFAIACAAIVLFAATAKAGDLAVTKSTLSSMGLGSMQTMSDNDGLAVRGKGTAAAVWGTSTAKWYGGQFSNNNYEAGSSWIGKSSGAKGSSYSFAGKIQVNYAADPTGSALQISAIGGLSFGGASAKAW